MFEFMYYTSNMMMFFYSYDLMSIYPQFIFRSGLFDTDFKYTLTPLHLIVRDGWVFVGMRLMLMFFNIGSDFILSTKYPTYVYIVNILDKGTHNYMGSVCINNYFYLIVTCPLFYFIIYSFKINSANLLNYSLWLANDNYLTFTTMSSYYINFTLAYASVIVSYIYGVCVSFSYCMVLCTFVRFRIDSMNLVPFPNWN